MLFPLWALGSGGGWAFQGSSPNPVLYGELQGRLRWGPIIMRGLGLGWAWEPAVPAAHGPQITASMGPLFLRASYLRERGLGVLLGINLHATFVLLWSR